MNRQELIMLQSLPYDIKVAKSKQRIREAIDHFGAEHLYVPVSGGLDSTVVDDLVKEVENELDIPKGTITRVNSNTGNEYPSVLAKARELSDVEVTPKKSFYKVLSEEGYPVASKRTSRMLRDLQNPTEKNYNTRRLYETGIKKDGTKGTFKLAKRWKVFIDSDVRCTEKCCQFLKKEPLMRYEKESKRHPFIGTMADEKGSRESGYLKTGCIDFKNGKIMPIGFWTKTDSLIHVLIKDISIPHVYGEIVVDRGSTLESITKGELAEMLKENKKFRLDTTKEKRTGCVACTFGVQFEPKNNNRFHRLKELDPKFYDFVIKGGHVDIDGNFKPKAGLGMGHILDMMGIDYGSYEE